MICQNCLPEKKINMTSAENLTQHTKRYADIIMLQFRAFSLIPGYTFAGDFICFYFHLFAFTHFDILSSHII